MSRVTTLETNSLVKEAENGRYSEHTVNAGALGVEGEKQQRASVSSCELEIRGVNLVKE